MRLCCTQSKIEFYGGYELHEQDRFGTANAIISFFGINLQTFFYFGRFINEFETLMFLLRVNHQMVKFFIIKTLPDLQKIIMPLLNFS